LVSVLGRLPLFTGGWPCGTSLAPKVMILCGLLLGAVAGINCARRLWLVFGWKVGDIAIAVPVGAVTRPAVLVLRMALLAGWSVGATAGKLAWGPAGEMGGQFTGALAGLAGWLAWLLLARGKKQKEAPPGSTGV
jgi:hypothetical protein